MVQSTVGPGLVCSAWSQQSAYNCYPDYVTGKSVLETCKEGILLCGHMDVRDGVHSAPLCDLCPNCCTDKLNNHPWDNVGILIAMAVVWRLFAYCVLVRFVSGKK